MSAGRTLARPSDPVDLASEPDFALGVALVHPSGCEVVVGEARSRLQPRVMQVLVALSRAEGAVVARDDLISCCWGGVAVGDDALNRCIQRLRRLGEEFPGSMTIETIPRIGYRLRSSRPEPASAAPPQMVPPPLEAAPAPPIEADHPAEARPPTHEPVGEATTSDAPRALGWPRARVVIVALLLALVAFSFWHLHDQVERPLLDGVALKPFDAASDAPLARSFASGVAYEVAHALSKADVAVIGPDAPSGRRHAAFVLGGRSELAGPNLHFNADLEDMRTHELLWSATFDRPPGEAQDMKEQVAAKLADVLHCALDTSSYPGGRIQLDTVKLYLRACDLGHASDASMDQVRDLYRQVVMREPQFALAWSRLAYASANAAFEMAPDQATAAREEGRRAAETALRLNPKDGLAYEALADLDLGKVRYDQLYSLFRQGLAVEPNNADLLQDEAELLLRVGRADDAVALSRRAVELEPLAPNQTSDLIDALIGDGRVDEAQSLMDRAARIWPDDPSLKMDRFGMQLRYGDPSRALAVLEDPQARSPGTKDIRLELFRKLLTARRTRSAADAKALVAADLAAYQAGQIGFAQAMLDLTEVGALDAAFRLADALPPQRPTAPPGMDPEFLWRPFAEGLRRDPRFIALAAKLGVAEFWRRTGQWPDFCSAPGWPYDCRRVAATLAAR